MKKILLMIIGVLTLGTLQAQELENSLLWEISGNGLKQPSYLYGTIHMIGTDDFFMTDETKKAFKKSKQLALEIDLDEMKNPIKMLFTMMPNMLMKDGSTLKDLLSDEDYKLVHNYIIDSMGINGFMANMLEKVKPMFLSEMVGMDMSSIGEAQPTADGEGGTTSYEMVFAEMAEQQEIEMLGLESVQYQMSIFDSIPYQQQAEMFVDAIKNGDEEEGDMLDELVELYKKQDLNGLNKMMNIDDVSDFNRFLLVNRNKNWIPKIGELAKEKPTFVAVGAGHLPGKQGVIQLLKEAGYDVKPLHQSKP